jgi:hypothetical protein
MAQLLHEFFMKLLGWGNPSYQQVAPKKSSEISIFFLWITALCISTYTLYAFVETIGLFFEAWLLNFICSQTHVRSDSDHTGDGWVPTPIHQEGDQRILCGI